MSAVTRTRKGTTMVDIAKHMGVSVSTVSRALNDSHDINQDTRKKVLEAANELNYTPNEMARSLVKQTNNTIAAIIPDILNPYYSELIKSIETVLSQNNFTLLLCITNESDVQVDYYLNEMLKKRVSGILLLSTFVKNKALLEKIKKNTIVVGVSTSHEGIDQISSSNKEGTYSIIKHLLELGHKRIAFIGYKLYENSILSSRLVGYKKAIEEAGLPFDESLVIDGKPVGYPGYEDAKILLEMKNKPTAIHCMNEYLAMGAYMTICDEGLRIPEDISLTAHDGLKISKLIRPKLTTVKIPVSAMGEAAAEFMLHRITYGKKEERQLLLFDSKVIFGDSTAPPKNMI